ncbi:MAG: hypothetical protein BMS9Abin18_0124 [Zetaproteobacteria bacterium]|nr:MAG: hypothetical protein BMS9Abin18_0124 [Zetaproteobacteria bacterium]
MRKGERWIAAAIGTVVVLALVRGFWPKDPHEKPDPGIPFYSTASKELAREASDSYRNLGCRDCHSLWGVRNIMQFVPAPMLDGIGSLRDEAWFYQYLSAENPQGILPSRLKKKYRMPSYAYLPEARRRMLAKYLASLKVKDWYLEETRKDEHEKLTGKPFQDEDKVHQNNGRKN